MAEIYRVKRYAHAKYKFVVRAKIGNAWKRRYFSTREEADSYADAQNALALGRKSRAPRQNREADPRVELQPEREIERHLQMQPVHESAEGAGLETGTLQSALAEERNLIPPLSSQLETEGSKPEEMSAALGQLQTVLNTSQLESSRLRAALDMLCSNEAGLRICNAALEQRLDTWATALHAAGAHLLRRDPAMPGIVDCILKDIARIHNPSFGWKLAKSLGILRFAQPGVPRTASDRRALATELKASLRDIQRALSSPTAPEDVTEGISRLSELRRKTTEIAHSLDLFTTLRLEAPIWNIVHWTRHDSNRLSTVTPFAVLFDAAWYLGRNPDVAASGIEPLKHFSRWGWREGRNPNPVFETSWYLARNADVVAEDRNPLEHYWEFGAAEGRDPSPLFNTEWYRTENPDVAAEGVSALQHFLKHGANEGRDPHPLFDLSWYLIQNPEVAGLNPLEHYLRWGGRHGRSPHPLFDAAWYLAQYQDVANSGIDPAVHYLEIGGYEGRNPNALFDGNFYLEQLRAAGSSFENPLLHYLSWGWKHGFKPSERFDPDFYLRAYPDVHEAGLEPLTDYILEGRSQGRLISSAGITFEPYRPSFEICRESQTRSAFVSSDIKAIAFYLPQFHQIAENDAWWGEGFTEWTFVRRGLPNFTGHYQPHVPSALGYYNLNDAEVLQKQIDLAKSHGIHGFCFYYYWFSGQVLLDRPLRRMIETGRSDFPFCICWANENWTRRWDGKDQDTLMSQKHSAEDDLAFIRHVEPILLSENYIRVRGRPLLLVYRPSLFPNAAATAERWRNYFRKRGHGELHLAMVRSFTEARPEYYGFDAVLQFPPHSHPVPITPLIEGAHPDFRGYVYDYSELRRSFIHELESIPPGLTAYPGVMPSWDNTARRLSKATTWVNTCPEAYFEWLTRVVELLRARPDPEDRLVFINAWNEWGEGCHLEPDERFGHAWLNATALALQVEASHAIELSSSVFHPEPPVQQPIELEALPPSLKVTISVLFYHREDIIPSFLRTLLPQMRALDSDNKIQLELYLVFNYQPTPALHSAVQDVIKEILPEGGESVHLVENGFNVGFGAGHNAVFARSESDIFVMLNSDVRIAHPNWLLTLVQRFRASDAAIIGLAATASRLREDGCGIPIAPGEQDFDFVDGSVLAVRSDLARRYGLFSDAFDYFYFEDVDLCLRYRQLGLRLELLDLPYEHERSSSSRLLPQYALEGVLNRNRARFFQRWEHYLQTRELPNRLALRFVAIDRQLQCASLPAIFGLLSEHPGAILDLSGVHEQLVPLFHHPRLRLIPSWQTLRRADYLRYYEIEASPTREEAPMLAIAARLGCKPDLDRARSHLRSLVAGKELQTKTRRALLFLPRKDPLFEGLQPEPDTFVPIRKLLTECGFEVDLATDLGRFEMEDNPNLMTGQVTYAGTASGLEILDLVVTSELVLSCDNWISELGQLLDRKTFVWLGATSSSHALWNLEKVGFFSDRALSCLGCYHRFGHNRRNTCLRGDTACMRKELAGELLLTLRRFLEGTPMTAAEQGRDRWLAHAGAQMPSSELRLAEYWPPSRAASVLVLIPVNPKLDQATIDRAKVLAEQAVRGMHGCRVILDDAGVAPPRGVSHPTRQEAMAAIRQAMVDRHLKDERWIFWVDADIADYPAHLVDELITRAEGGIAAPIVLMEGKVSEPLSNKFGFGPGRFYDVAGFVENGRWARFTQPFFDQLGPVYQLDSVGTCYLLNADLYRHGARHEADFASKKFVEDDNSWGDDSISRNQVETANSFTEHYSLCEFTRRAGLPVRAFSDLVAYHEKPRTLPLG